MFHVSKRHFQVGDVIARGNWGQIVCGMAAGHSAFYREMFWEHIRANEFADRPSRLDCTYAYADADTARAYIQENEFISSLYRVEPVDGGGVHHADLSWIDLAPYRTGLPQQAADIVRAYWRGEPMPGGRTHFEVLIPADVRVVEVLARASWLGR